jgi:acyl carrier protein
MPMDRDAIEKKVREMIIDSLGIDPEKISTDSSFVDDLGADSLDTVELVMAFEEEFDVEIPDEDAENLATVGDAINYLEKNIGE